MTYRNSKYVDFETGKVTTAPMEFIKQLPRPWSDTDCMDIFECRVEVWQLGVAAAILNQIERSGPEVIWGHSAYGLLSVVSSYFEMIGKTLNPKSNGWSGDADFSAGFLDVYKTATPVQITEIRDRVRNGLYHLGYTKRGLWLENESGEIGDTYFGKRNGFEMWIVNPHRVTRTIVDHFPGFMARLRADLPKGLLRRQFRVFFDDFHLPQTLRGKP